MRVATVVSLSMGIVALATAILVERVVSPQQERQASVRVGVTASKLMAAALDATSKISSERGPSNSVLGSELPIPAERSAALAKARKATDESLQAVVADLPADFPQKAAIEDSLAAVRGQLRAARGQIDSLSALPRPQRPDARIKDAVTAMIDTIPLMAPGLNTIENALVQADPALTNYVTIARLTTEMRDVAGQLGSVFTPAFALKRPLGSDEIRHVERLLGMIQSLDHQLRLAHGKTGASEALASALALIDRDFLEGGLPLVRRILDTGQTSGDYGMSAAEFAKVYVPQMNVILELRTVALKAVAQRMGDIDADSRRSLLIGKSLAALVMLSLLATYLLIRGRLTRPLGQISTAMKQLEAGNYQLALPTTRWNDEIGDVSTAMGHLADVIHLREVEGRMSGIVAEVSAHIQLADDLPALAQAFFGHLADPLGIGAASLYRYESQGPQLQFVGGYATRGNLSTPPIIQPGENLVGECARQRRPILISHPADHYLKIHSGLGECLPTEILILPVILRNELLGVIEMATFSAIDDDLQAAIDKLLPILAMRMMIVIRSERAEKLTAVAPAPSHAQAQ